MGALFPYTKALLRLLMILTGSDVGVQVIVRVLQYHTTLCLHMCVQSLQSLQHLYERFVTTAFTNRVLQCLQLLSLFCGQVVEALSRATFALCGMAAYVSIVLNNFIVTYVLPYNILLDYLQAKRIAVQVCAMNAVVGPEHTMYADICFMCNVPEYVDY
jgi:hypothetical protein